MKRKRSHGLAIGMLLSFAAASAVMTAITLGGFSSSSGDMAVSSSASPFNLALIAAGALVLVALEVWHISGRRPEASRLRRPEAART
jgi:hypothetical protein